MLSYRRNLVLLLWTNGGTVRFDAAAKKPLVPCPYAPEAQRYVTQKSMRRILIALVLFGIAFGYLEAAVVVYLRTIYEPIRQKISPRPSGELFPLITPQQLAQSGPENTRRLWTELGREAATLLMLAAIGLAVARNFQQWTAAFLIAFGVWDISFYVFLRLLIQWPESLLTWDLLFLIPVPWVGPVLAPVIVSLSMIGCGYVALTRTLALKPRHWIAILAGGAIVVVACCLDFPNTTRGGTPNPFHWGVFTAGELLGLAGFAAAVVNSRSLGSQTPPGY